MNKRDYERKRAKVKRQKRFQNNERAALRRTIPKTAQKHRGYVRDDLDDFGDAPDGVQFRE